jgi:hypothetical protein
VVRSTLNYCVVIMLPPMCVVMIGAKVDGLHCGAKHSPLCVVAQCCNVRCYDRGKVMVHLVSKHSQLCVVRNAAMCGVMIGAR